MCGRFTLTTPRQAVARLFDLLDVPEMAPRYNVAPTQPVAAGRELVQLRWGLVPS